MAEGEEPVGFPARPEYDFVGRPSRDYFCPVSLELLLEPRQTTCCGQHISLEVADRLIRQGKPCPMCNSQSWDSQQDKYHQRKVNEVKVRCWYKDRGCMWQGEVRELEAHAISCKRKPWLCTYCKIECEQGEGEENHWPQCPKFPTPCPNGCEIGSVKRCAMEEHLKVCPLERVTCEMKEFGCEVVVPRKDLPDHMKESGIQHMISMTALNLRLTKQLQSDVTELKHTVAEQASEIAKVERSTFTIHGIVAQQQTNLASVTDKLNSVDESVTELASNARQLNLSTIVTMQESIGGTSSCIGQQTFMFRNYYLFRGSEQSQYSPPFYTHVRGYKLRLQIAYNSAPENDISANLCMMVGEFDKWLYWPVTIQVRLEVMNQEEDFRHVVKVANCTWEYGETGAREIVEPVMKYATLEREQEDVIFVMDDSLEFRVTVTVI